MSAVGGRADLACQELSGPFLASCGSRDPLSTRQHASKRESTRAHCGSVLDRMGKLTVFLEPLISLPPHKGSQKTLFMEREGAEAWKTGTRLGGCFWAADFFSV
jgi:hypothetical protein